MDVLEAAGFHRDCSASRGILLSNILGKSYRKLVRKRTMPYLQDTALQTMCGGISHRGCDFASHLLNATLDLSRLRKKSTATFFVGEIAAFGGVLHSFIVDLELSDESILYLMNRLNLPSECLADLCAALNAPSAPSAAGVPEHLQGVISDILNDNWFLIDNNPNPCTISRNTKPGDLLADLLFNFFAAVILKSIRSALSDAGYGVPVNPVSTTLFGDASPGVITDLSYVEDCAFSHEISDNTKAVYDIQTITAIDAGAFYAYALLPNVKKGKSEWMVCLRGPDFISVIHEIFVTCQAQIICEVYDNHSVTVHFVPLYRHLGDYATPFLKAGAHIQHRVK